MQGSFGPVEEKKMDKVIQTLAEDALWYVEQRRLKQARAEIERKPKPEKITSLFAEWKGSQQKLLEEQIQQFSKNIASIAEQRILETWNLDDFKRGVVETMNKEVMKILSPFILLEFLPYLEKAMSDIVERRQITEWQSRFQDLDGHIKQAEREISQRPPFSPSHINTDNRFPIDRIAWDQGKPFDKWLTESLKSRKPIFFDAENYVGKLVEFYEQIYLPLAKKEKEEKAKEESSPLPHSSVEGGEKYQMPLSGQVEFGLLPKIEDDGPRSKLYNVKK